MRGATGASRLRFTVSGGLESWAENEVREKVLLGRDDAVEITWPERGNSGSQLEIICPAEAVANIAFQAVRRLRLVDYAYMEVCSVGVDASCAKIKAMFKPKGGEEDLTFKEGLLDRIQDGASKVPREAIDRALKTCRECEEVLRAKGVGLEGLPGVLLPTPEIVIDDSDVLPESCAKHRFVVNTIYTQPQVARAVVRAFVELVQTHAPEICQRDMQWIDAGAGSGSLLRHLPSDVSIGIDTHPRSDAVHQMDFLRVTKEWLRGRNQDRLQQQQLCVISNPPFTERSRGDYSAIVKFVNHAIELGALFIGLIVPAKFCRERVWHSLGMNEKARLLARFVLPNDAFYDPSSGNSRHISSYFLFFGLAHTADISVETAMGEEQACESELSVHVEGKRDKGCFPFISTADFTRSVVSGMQSSGFEMASEADAQFTLAAKLKSVNDQTANVVLSLLLNPKRPLSLANCVSRCIPRHSLGWISTSAKPPLAYAMCSIVTGYDNVNRSATGRTRSMRDQCSIVVNAMCGEGTIELESQDTQLSHPYFVISGDKSASAAAKTAARLAALGGEGGANRPRIDVVVWDAQRLPLRDGVADAFTADMPFAGSTKKAHQEPSAAGDALDASLDYRLVMAQAVRTLKPGGRAALLSADAKALGHAVGKFNWCLLWKSKALNLGGLSGKLLLMERKEACFKDLSMWVAPDTTDLSQVLAKIATDACASFYLNSAIEILEVTSDATCFRARPVTTLVSRVELRDTYFHEGKQSFSHCYRMWFDDVLNNIQSKILEKRIRLAIEEKLPEGHTLR